MIFYLKLQPLFHKIPKPKCDKQNKYLHGIIEGGDIDPWDIENAVVVLNLELCLIIN